MFILLIVNEDADICGNGYLLVFLYHNLNDLFKFYKEKLNDANKKYK